MSWSHFLCYLHANSFLFYADFLLVLFTLHISKLNTNGVSWLANSLLARLLYLLKSCFSLYLLNNNLPNFLTGQAHKWLKDLTFLEECIPLCHFNSYTKLQNHFFSFIYISIAITSMLVLIVFCITSNITIGVSYNDYNLLLA